MGVAAPNGVLRYAVRLTAGIRMPVRRVKPAPKTGKKPPTRKPAPAPRSAKPARLKAAKTTGSSKGKAAGAKARPRSTLKTAVGIEPLDLSALPVESVTQLEKWICLACVLDVFTRHMELAPKTAYLEIKRYTPPVAELTSSAMTRPDCAGQPPKSPCPYCGSPSKWHARLWVYRIESGKATDGSRRELVKSLPKSDDQFLVLEEKATQQHAFFEWLEKISTGLNLDDPVWLRD